MNKRFIDTSILPKTFRKLDASLKLSWFYIWCNCDYSGVWEIDEDLFEFENGFELNLNRILESFNGLIEINKSRGLVLIKDFIRVNYCDFEKLNPDYNPHKPLFRDIKKNQLSLISSLNQACLKHIDEDIDEEEDKDEEEEVEKEKKRKEKDFNESDSVEIYPTFEDFWDLYDKKVGKKSKIKKKWEKLSQQTKESIMLHVEAYIISQPEKKYRKNPETYLNNESWNDEIIQSEGRNANQPTDYNRYFRENMEKINKDPNHIAHHINL